MTLWLSHAATARALNMSARTLSRVYEELGLKPMTFTNGNGHPHRKFYLRKDVERIARKKNA